MLHPRLSEVVPMLDQKWIVGTCFVILHFVIIDMFNIQIYYFFFFYLFRSLGVLLYTLVYGAMPFDGSNFKRLVKQITNGDYYEPKHPSSASNLIRTMLTVSSEKRANIGDICSHWWVNDGYGQTCLEEAEYLASLTPVRLDLLLSLARSEKEDAEQVRINMSIGETYSFFFTIFSSFPGESNSKSSSRRSHVHR